MDQKGQYFAQNDQKCIYWAKFGCFWAKILIFWRKSKIFGTHISENQLGSLFPLFFCSGIAPQWTRKANILLKNANYWPNLAVSLFWNRNFLAKGHIINILGAAPQKIFTPKNFPKVGPWSTKLGGTVPATKKTTHNDTGPGTVQNCGETAVFMFCRKVENGPKIRFFLEVNPFLAQKFGFRPKNPFFAKWTLVHA